MAGHQWLPSASDQELDEAMMGREPTDPRRPIYKVSFTPYGKSYETTEDVAVLRYVMDYLCEIKQFPIEESKLISFFK